tara:strand:+ start:137914 stop:138204 length:291 start_codon:yes stop_codon:yes gene_type:complete
MKIHQKGFLLVELSQHESLWDTDLIATVLKEYELSGNYWINSFCVTLDELSSAGLVARIDSRLEQTLFTSKSRVMFKYQLTEFGRSRMYSTGLLTA